MRIKISNAVSWRTNMMPIKSGSETAPLKPASERTLPSGPEEGRWTSLPSTRHMLNTLSSVAIVDEERIIARRNDRIGSFFLKLLGAGAVVLVMCFLLAWTGLVPKEDLRLVAELAYISVLALFGVWSVWMLVDFARFGPKLIFDLAGTLGDRIDRQKLEDDVFLRVISSVAEMELEEGKKRIEFHLNELAHRSTTLAAIVACVAFIPKLLPILADSSNANPVSLDVFVPALTMGAILGGLFFAFTKPRLTRLAFVLGLAADRAKGKKSRD